MGKISIDVKGKWWRYATIIPEEYKILGVVKVGSFRGVLARSKETGEYVQVRSNSIRLLPKHQIRSLLKTVGKRNPPKKE